MAYKSRVSQNQYFGAAFAGQARSSRSTDATDLVASLKSISPDLEKLATVYTEDKNKKAQTKMQELMVTKDADTIRQEILAGKHPELSSQYVQKTVNFHTGKHEAAATIAEIENNKNKYNFKNGDNLSGFYKQYLPDFNGKDGSYALGFAAVFNEYKADEAIKDGKERAAWAQEQKINQGVGIVKAGSPDTWMSKINGLNLEQPQGSLYTNEELNDVTLQLAENIYKTAKTTEEIDNALMLLTTARKTDENGKTIIGSLSSTNRADVASLEGNLQIRRVNLENQSRVEKENQKQDAKDDIWIRSTAKDENGNKPSITDVIKLAEEYRQTDPADIKGYNNFVAWHTTPDKDKVIADPQITSKFKLDIAKNTYTTSDEMLDDFFTLGIAGDPSEWLAKWQQSYALRGAKPIFDQDANYTSQKEYLAKQLTDKYKVVAKEGVDGVNFSDTAIVNATEWIDEQILDQEEAWKKEGKTPSSTDRRKLAKDLRMDALELFAPTDEGMAPTTAPSVAQLSTAEQEAEIQTELAAEEDARAKQALNQIAYQTATEGGIINTTVQQLVDNIKTNIDEEGTQKMRSAVLSGVIKPKDGKTAEEVAFEKIQVPRITKYVKNILGVNFDENVLAVLPQKEYNNIRDNLIKAWGLYPTLPDNLTQEDLLTSPEVQKLREAQQLFDNIIENVITEKQ